MGAPVEQGQILAGKYRVDRVLGEGGMGVVVAATDTALERRVAIKFLLPEYAEHTEASVRFMREARAAVKIQSEHIARVIDVNEMDNGSPYMVMEFLEGGDLSQVIEQHKQLPIDEAVLYTLQACDAIAEAHSYGIVHRDLKPANLFLAKQPDGSSKVKVLDFGISKTTVVGPDTADASLTRTSSMMGSPLYMSPEQMRSTKDVDARTDIWALGVILYELLTGKLPFDAVSIPELSAKILLEDPEPILRPDVPEALKAVILRAMTKDPNARYPSVAEFSMALAEYAPKRGRANVERISRLLTNAGMSQSALQLPPSIPAPSLAATQIEVDLAESQGARAHAGTIADWSNTQGPRTQSGGGMGKWIVAASVSLLLIGGGATALVMMSSGGAESEAALAATPELQPAPDPVEQPQPEVQPAELAVAEQATAERATAEENAAGAAGVPQEAASAQAASAAPPPEAPPKRVAPRPKPIRKPKPVAQKPTPPPAKTTKKPSLRDKWGGRK